VIVIKCEREYKPELQGSRDSISQFGEFINCMNQVQQLEQATEAGTVPSVGGVSPPKKACMSLLRTQHQSPGSQESAYPCTNDDETRRMLTSNDGGGNVALPSVRPSTSGYQQGGSMNISPHQNKANLGNHPALEKSVLVVQRHGNVFKSRPVQDDTSSTAGARAPPSPLCTFNNSIPRLVLEDIRNATHRSGPSRTLAGGRAGRSCTFQGLVSEHVLPPMSHHQAPASSPRVARATSTWTPKS
jgi:hypothetical protein